MSKHKLTAEQKRMIKLVIRDFEELLTEHLTNHLESGGSFLDEITKVSKKVANTTADFVTSEDGQKMIKTGFEHGLPIAIKILAGNIARINHMANLQPMTKEEIQFYEANHQKHMHGSGFWGDFYDGFKSIMKPGLDILTPIVTKVPIPVGSLAFGALDKVVGKGVRKQGGFRVAGSDGESVDGASLRVAGSNESVNGSALRVGGDHRVTTKQRLLGQDEVSKPPAAYRLDYQREMAAQDYV